MQIGVDIETYSSVDIKKAGAYRYASAADFDILLCAYAVDDDPVQLLDLTQIEGQEAFLTLIETMRMPGVTLRAYNAAFEWWCINTWCRRRGVEEIPIEKWRCTMAHAMYLGYSAGLAATGEAVGIPADKRKMGVGSALIRKFCVPQKKGPVRITPEMEPEKWQLFGEYCAQDVAAEREIERRLAPWPMPQREQQLWEMDVAMNARGVGADMELVRGALAIGAAESERLLERAKQISGLAKPKSVAQLKK